LTPFRRRSPTEHESQSETAAHGSYCFIPNRGAITTGFPSIRSSYCVTRPSRGRPVSWYGNRTHKLQLRENVGTFKTGVYLRRLHDTGPFFATRNQLAAGTASFRPANRRRIHRMVDLIVETLAPGIHTIPGHDIPTSDVTYARTTLRTRAAAAASARQGGTDNNVSYRSPIRTLTRRLMIGLSISVRMTMECLEF